MYVLISLGGMKSPNVITELSQATNWTHTSPCARVKYRKLIQRRASVRWPQRWIAIFAKVNDPGMLESSRGTLIAFSALAPSEIGLLSGAQITPEIRLTSLCLNTVSKLHTKLADASVRLKPAVSIAAFKSGSVMYSSRINAPVRTKMADYSFRSRAGAITIVCYTTTLTV